MIKHYNIKIIGQVQGVSFRHWAKIKALQLGIKGFIKNLEDGSLYLEAEGQENQLENFLVWCKQGPPLAEIEKIEVEEREIKDYNNFSINY